MRLIRFVFILLFSITTHATDDQEIKVIRIHAQQVIDIAISIRDGNDYNDAIDYTLFSKVQNLYDEINKKISTIEARRFAKTTLKVMKKCEQRFYESHDLKTTFIHWLTEKKSRQQLN